MRTLITGGAGFIGSHLADALLGAGHEVIVIDDLSHGRKDRLAKGAALEVVDICDPKAAEVIAAARPEVVFHLAAQMDVRVSVKDPVFDARVNVVGTVNVATAAARSGCKTFVFASTGGAIYGDQNHFPADETHPCRPKSPYGLSKWCAEQYLAFLADTTPMRCIALRYANVYGPRQDPHGEAGVVAIFTGLMQDDKTPTIFGDGSQTRDYVYVSDVIAANLLALGKAPSGVYNVGTGRETRTLELAQMIGQALGFLGAPAFAPAREGEQQRSVISGAKIAQVMGWQAKVDLHTGIGKTVHALKRTPEGT